MKKINILGVGISNATKEEILEFMLKGLIKPGKKLAIFTPNPEIIMYAKKDVSFKKIINSAGLALPDGVGLIWAGKMLGRPFKERIPGADFMELLCEEVSKRGLTVGLMGGGPKIAERAAECLRLKHPELKITFASEGLPVNTKYIIPNTDILFVAFGFPKQEQWVYENLPKIPVQVAMAVGGSFDYISGVVPRAPLLIRKLGLEWFFRLIVQPWRLRRQLVLLEFTYLVLKEKLKLR